MLYTRKHFKEQYRVACWFVRFVHHAMVRSVVTDLNDYSDYYRGFRRAAKQRDGVDYPEIAEGSHIWLQAVNAWQHNPNKEG